jgi:hypothetical protein
MRNERHQATDDANGRGGADEASRVASSRTIVRASVAGTQIAEGRKVWSRRIASGIAVRHKPARCNG